MNSCPNNTSVLNESAIHNTYKTNYVTSAIKQSMKRMDATFTRIEQRQQSILDMLKQAKQAKQAKRDTQSAPSNDDNKENPENKDKTACGKGMNAAYILGHHYR
jgi:hypothetical protein